MSLNSESLARGQRIRKAMRMRGQVKATALAAELDVSPASLSKWSRGYTMSIDHACRLASILDISLDWLLLGRNSPEWLREDGLSQNERDLLEILRARPPRLTQLLMTLMREVLPQT